MTIPHQVALWLQSQLYLLTLDGYSPHSFLSPRYLSDLGEKVRWQLAVDLIGRCIVTDLICVSNREWMKAVGLNDSIDFVRALAMHDPFSFVLPSEGATYWLHPLLCGTDLCSNLVKKIELHKLEDNSLCDQFIEEVEDVFRAGGVEWKKTPLIKICE